MILALTVLSTLVAGVVPSEARLVAHVKRLPARRIDSHLGRETFETWLGKALGPDVAITWRSDDCGEGGDGDYAVPICVTAEAPVGSHGHVTISIAVGWSTRGIVGKPVFFFGAITGMGPSEILPEPDLPLLEAKLRTAREIDVALSGMPDRPLDEEGWIRQVRAPRSNGSSPAVGTTDHRWT